MADNKENEDHSPSKKRRRLLSLKARKKGEQIPQCVLGHFGNHGSSAIAQLSQANGRWLTFPSGSMTIIRETKIILVQLNFCLIVVQKSY